VGSVLGYVAYPGTAAVALRPSHKLLKLRFGTFASQTPTVRNHFIPEHYFRPWLDGSGHLIRYGWIAGKLTQDPKTPAQICYLKDLHTFTRPLGDLGKDAVEHWLTNVDTYGAMSIRHILEHGMPSLGDARATRLATFILSLIVRQPEQVGYLNNRAPDDFQAVMAVQDQAATDDPDLSPMTYSFGTLRQYVEEFHPGLSENIGRFLMTDIIADERYLRRILDLQWLEADFSTVAMGSVVTCDRLPIIVGTGLDDPHMVAILPLSPQKVIYLCPPELLPKLAAGGKGRLGIWTQQMILSSARQFAFGRSDSNINLIKKYLLGHNKA
jgi:hypothetical protein